MHLYRKELSYYVILILICCFSFPFAEPPDTLWTKTYGGEEWDVGYSVQQTLDGGYIITGCTESFGAGGEEDVWLIKTDVDGDTLWTRTFGEAYWRDEGYSVQQTTGGGYIIAGFTASFGAELWDVYLIRTDSSGDTLWAKIYKALGYEIGESVQQTSDGGYIIAADTPDFGRGIHGVYLIKTDSLGDTLWTKSYGDLWHGGHSVQQTADSGYIISGYKWASASRGDVWLLKTDVNGDTLWTKTYGGEEWDEGYSVQKTTDGGYIIAGYTNSFGAGSSDVYIIKSDSLGDVLWAKTYGDTAADVGYSIQQAYDGGYVIAGYTASFGAGGKDVWLIKTDANGDTLWTSTYGGAGIYDCGYSIQKTTDGGYIVAGYTNSFGAGSNDVYLIKTAPDTLGIKEKDVSSFKSNDFCTTILTGPLLLPEDKRCRIFDITGRVIMPDKMRPGIYFIEVDGQIIQKIVKMK